MYTDDKKLNVYTVRLKKTVYTLRGKINKCAHCLDEKLNVYTVLIEPNICYANSGSSPYGLWLVLWSGHS